MMLGRPVQAFDQLAQQLAQCVVQHLQRTGHRSVALCIAQAQFIPQRPPTSQTTQVTLHRATVQAHMAARYGFSADDAPTDAPANSTELRIHAALNAATAASVEVLCAQARAALPSTPISGGACAWLWQAQIQVAGGQWWPMEIALDAAASQALEQHALQLRRSQPSTAAHHAKPATPLHVNLTARLLEKTVSTADIQALRCGSVLPIALGRTTVLLNGEALLTATVAEHQGKLHLTAFETLE